MITNLLFLFVFQALAYVPPVEFILERMVQRGGKGSYKLTQEVLFQGSDQSLAVKEIWSIKDSSTYFLEVRSKAFTKFFVYRNGQKYFIDDTKNVKQTTLPKDFFELLFLARDSNQLKRELSSKKLLSVRTFNTPLRSKAQKEIHYNPDDYLPLSRSRGVINYTFIGNNKIPESSEGAALWVEQDKFIIRKLRLESGAEILADEFTDYSQGLTLPRSRKVNWNNQSVSMELLRVDSVSYKKDDNFSPSVLKDLATKFVPMEEIAIKPMVEEFYSRFR